MEDAGRLPTPLGRLMDHRRKQLSLTWRQLASVASVSYETLRAIRYGEQEPRDLTLAAIEQALQWEDGGLDRFLEDGTAPVPLPNTPTVITRAQAAAVLFADDTVAQAILVQTGKENATIMRELVEWLTLQHPSAAQG